MAIRRGISRLGLLLIVLIISLCGVYLGNFLISQYYNPQVENDNKARIANLNVIVNVGEPIYIKAINFTSVWPGQHGNLTIKLVNLAPITYTVHLKCSGLISPKEGKEKISLSFERKTIVIPGNSEVNVSIPFYVKSSAPIGIYEMSIGVYRGADIKNALLISELHLIGYVGGEPVQVVALEFPTLWPGSNGSFIIKLRNIANISYNISVSIDDMHGPNGDTTIKVFPINPSVIYGNSVKTLRIGVYLADNASVGTYVISITVRRS